jgi:hypothetical protein
MGMLPTSGEGNEAPAVLGTSGRSNLSPLSLARFPERCVFQCLKYRMLDKVHKPSDSENPVYFLGWIGTRRVQNKEQSYNLHTTTSWC